MSHWKTKIIDKNIISNSPRTKVHSSGPGHWQGGKLMVQKRKQKNNAKLIKIEKKVVNIILLVNSLGIIILLLSALKNIDKNCRATNITKNQKK